MNLTPPEVGDLFRGVSVALFCVLIVQVSYVLFYYFRVLKMERDIGMPKVGLLPKHVIVLGTALLGYSGVLTVITFRAVGAPVSWFTAIITVLHLFTVWGIRIVMAFERRRYEGVVEVLEDSV